LLPDRVLAVGSATTNARVDAGLEQDLTGGCVR